ncbi:MAG: hypothetical protein GY707_05545 [Desulfobacteraceae bacterium]|nr:hypothetical protein [Desulfobacteraceae bacterium]
MPEWTDELKTEVVEAYKTAKPTPENTMDIVKEIAQDFDATPNGVRSILSKAGEYIKKTTSSSASGDKPKSTRINKAEAQGLLIELIESRGKEADEDIISKLTGKAAMYLLETFKEE